MEQKKATKGWNITADVCRVLLGLTFVFSGFVKTIDPWGTALKIGEYLNVYGATGAGDSLRITLAILFCAAELLLGLLLVFKLLPRLTSLASLVVMSAFLVVTFLSATVLPVEDCGCFGDALHLSPWASFGKNVVLFALALETAMNARRRFPFSARARGWIAAVVLGCLSVGLGLLCYIHLPLIDFLPFKKGTNLYEAKYDTASADPAGDIALREFTVFNSGGDATYDILSDPGRVYILCAANLSEIGERCAERFAGVAKRAATENSRVILVTSSPLPASETVSFAGSDPVPAYNLDRSTMITMLRAKTGMITIEDGTIKDKRNCRDIK